jgi:hypothetical protein
MERAGTIFLRVTLVGLPVGLVLLYLALVPSGMAEVRIAAGWYLGRLASSLPFAVLAAASGAALLLWFIVRSLAAMRFSRAMREGAVPARRVETRANDQLVAQARAALEPELTRHPDLPRLIDVLLGTPVDLGAAELAMTPDPFGVQLSLRFGMDRVPVTTMPSETFAAVLERLRLIVGVDDLGHGTIELRGSAGSEWIEAHIEAASGNQQSEQAGPHERTAVRLVLSRRSGYSRTLEQLGMREDMLAQLGAALEQPRGLIVLAGTSKAGLTTTLYAAAHRLHRSGKRPDALVAIEPHVRLELPFMLQLEVGSAQTAAVLRQALAHRYEAVLLRKLGDEASASLALQAARERLVVVTVETDGALSALHQIARLVDPKLLAETLLLAQAQLLLPSLCKRCRSEGTLSEQERRMLDRFVPPPARPPQFELPQVVHRSPGCEHCGGRGSTAKRTPLFWGIERSDWLGELLASKPKLQELRRKAFERSYRGPVEVALELAGEGKVSIDEVLDLARQRSLP